MFVFFSIILHFFFVDILQNIFNKQRKYFTSHFANELLTLTVSKLQMVWFLRSAPFDWCHYRFRFRWSDSISSASIRDASQQARLIPSSYMVNLWYNIFHVMCAFNYIFYIHNTCTISSLVEESEWNCRRNCLSIIFRMRILAFL